MARPAEAAGEAGVSAVEGVIIKTRIAAALAEPASANPLDAEAEPAVPAAPNAVVGVNPPPNQPLQPLQP
jgi:hypothetical protein